MVLLDDLVKSVTHSKQRDYFRFLSEGVRDAGDVIAFVIFGFPLTWYSIFSFFNLDKKNSSALRYR